MNIAFADAMRAALNLTRADIDDRLETFRQLTSF